MALYRDQGIVLRTFRLGEADRIITLLTQGHGKVRAVVKGVRKTRSRFGSRLEPFVHVDVQMYEGRGELQIVSQAELINGYPHIRDDYDAYACAQLICEATDCVAPEHEPNVRLVLLTLHGLRAIETAVTSGRHPPYALRSAYLLKLLGISGFAPSLRVCAHCGGGDGLCAFSFGEGGVVCGTCRAAGDAILGAEGVRALRCLWSTPLADLGEIGAMPPEVDAVVQSAVEYHLDRRLRSMQLRPI